MTTFTTAYSKEICREISAREANNLYAKNIIRDKWAFTCPHERCQAPMTCINLDRPKAIRRREPYFKTNGTIGLHSPTCAAVQAYKGSKQTIRPAKKFDLVKASDIRLLLRLEEIAPRANLGVNPDRPEDRRAVSGSSGRGQEGPRGPNNTYVRRLKRLVDEYNSGDTNPDRIVEFDGQETPIGSLFFSIDDADDLPAKTMVFHGRGYLNKRDESVTLRFHNTIILEGVSARPYTILKRKPHTEEDSNLYLESMIEVCSKADEDKISLYVLASPSVISFKSNKGEEKKTIRLRVNGPECVYFEPKR